MREILLALILAGAGLQIPVGADTKGKDPDVQYKGPVVYTNLPPPVLYFPSFPEKPKFSNRGSAGDTEEKKAEYVPFPYKDLPLLVYRSGNQPPVHVVEKSPNQNSEKDEQGSSQPSSGYQTGPAVYREKENDRYDNEEADSTNRPQAVIPNSNEKFINVGLTTSQIRPAIDTQNQQYISIGLTSIQPQASAQHNSVHPDSSQQVNNIYNQEQYSQSQNADQADYPPQNGEHLGQSGSAYSYYSAQYPNQNVGTQVQVPVEQISQAIQNYLVQHNNAQQQAQSVIQQTLLSYNGKQDSYSSPSERSPPQVGITIIRQPAVPDVSEHEENEPQHATLPRHPPVQINSNQGYDNNQQYVTIGVYPGNMAGNDYGQDPQQYYNSITPVQNDQYQNMNEDYRQASQSPEKPPTTQNENAQTTGYQLISIDLSALRNQNADQQRNAYQEYPQQIQKPLNNPPPQNYRPQNEKDNSYGSEKEYQQILIQIPQNIISKQAENPPRARGPYEAPYTGTAQVANVLGDSSKAYNGHSGNMGSTYHRPPPQRPAPNIHHSERPRNPPNEAFGFPQKGMISNGINIAIIKQTDSTNNSPIYKPSEKRPVSHPPLMRTPTHPMVNRNPPPPSYFQGPRRPSYAHPNRPSSTNLRFNYGREAQPFGQPSNYPTSTTRYHSRQNVGQYRNRPLVRNLGGHPGIYASSNLHYTTVIPNAMRPPTYNNAFPMSPPMTLTHASATKNHAQYVPSPFPFHPHGSKATMQAFTNNISNGFGEINFDEINAFLNPGYDLFGSLTNGPDKQKVEDETKFLQKVTSDLLNHDLNAVSLAEAIPPYNIVKPLSNIQTVPFPYKYWEQPMAHFGPPIVVDASDRTRFMGHYSHMQHPYTRGRPLSPLGKGKGRKRGLGKGYRGLRRKLAELRTSIRHKSKITPRQEVTGDESVTSVSEQITDTSVYEKAAPRSTIIKTDGPGLDGITIPLNPEHTLSSRISNDDDREKGGKLPPIIIYKGSKPPVEIYGSKTDIENKVNETEKVTPVNYDEPDVPTKSSSVEQPEVLSSQETAKTYSNEDVGSYIDYMYSMLPDLIRDTFDRRQDDDSNKWVPIRPRKYVLAKDTYNTNETSTEKAISPMELETSKDSSVAQNSSTNAESTIKENVEELFSLLGKEEKSDLVME